MKRLYGIVLLIFISIITMAQTKCYQGHSNYSGDILYTYDGLAPLPILLLMMNY